MSYTKENRGYRLKGKCFACNSGNDSDTWNHAKKNCCSSAGYLYINDKCQVSCDECKEPSFVMYWRFNCGNHETKDAYKEPNRRYLIAAISSLAKNGDIPDDIFTQMNKILLNEA